MPASVQRADEPWRSFRLGDWLVEPGLNRLSRGDCTVRLRPRAMDVLVCLAGEPGQVVSKQQLIDTVWRVEFVSENALTQVIAELRTELGDDARNPSYIENIPRRGYRLVAGVTFEDAPGREVAGASPLAAESECPYPGLLPFSQAHSKFFFGREAEVARMWRALSSRRMVAVIGPSGVGKSSFVRAGVVPAAPAGWRAIVCQPGDAPLAALARALVVELAGDPAALAELIDLRDPAQAFQLLVGWRHGAEEVLLVVDQFEELFTLCPSELRDPFAELLGRLAVEAGVHVVAAIRDDFLYECHAHAALAPLFEQLVPLRPPGRAALERALTKPAACCGYRFEDEDIVREMVAAAADEKDALPLLAFAAERLWDERDQERRLLTREAFVRIGGVAGALARSAEHVLERIGAERAPLVREIFRNLVTAKGTRAVRAREDLLSVFDEPRRVAAADVLQRLVDERLLVAFVDDQASAGTSQRVEIVHESLLSQWPRLVRWRAQDAEGAVLRDQLRQAARLWSERGRPADLLWSGSAFREVLLWRERFPGGLSDEERRFVAAMEGQAHARRRRRRLTGLAMLVAAALIATTTTALWWRGARQARRAEAARLVALGQLELDSMPALAIAFAVASLERADTPEARRLAVAALWRGPADVVVSSAGPRTASLKFSPDGKWLAIGRPDGTVDVFPSDGGPPLHLGVQGSGWVANMLFSDSSDVLIACHAGGAIDFWSFPEGRKIDTIHARGNATIVHLAAGGRRLVAFSAPSARPVSERLLIDAWSLDTSPVTGLAAWEMDGTTVGSNDVDPSGTWVAVPRGREIFIAPLLGPPSRARRIGIHEDPVRKASFSPSGDTLATVDALGEVRLWPLTGGGRPTSRRAPTRTAVGVGFDKQGRWLWSVSGTFGTAWLWDLLGLPDAKPITIGWSGHHKLTGLDFHPDGTWLVATTGWKATLFPLGQPRVRVLPGHDDVVQGLAFAPDGSWLASSGADASVKIWPLTPTAGDAARTLYQKDDSFAILRQVAVDPNGRFLVVSGNLPHLLVIPVDGGPARSLSVGMWRVFLSALDPSGDHVAAAGNDADRRGNVVIRVLAVADGTVVREFDLGPNNPGVYVHSIGYSASGELFASLGREGRLVRLDVEAGTETEAVAAGVKQFTVSRDRNRLIAWAGHLDDPRVVDLDTGETSDLSAHRGNTGWVGAATLDRSGSVAAIGDATGAVRVGVPDGREPHLLLAHEVAVSAVAISPDGTWIASGARDGTICLWPMPDVSRRPLHALPLAELLARLKSFTNARLAGEGATPDTLTTRSNVGIVFDRFPGWETTPEW